MNELNQHKRSDKIKWIFTVVAFVLVFVMLAGVIMQIFGKGKVKPSEWFKKPETEQTQTSADDIVITPIESNGIELCSAAVPLAAYESYGIDPQSVENVFELSVTYTPANTTYQDTDYTISFKNANSTWATGKNVTDYAALQHENGSKNSVLTIIKAFEEQIIVTARSQRDETKTATFTVDYVCPELIADFVATSGVTADSDLAIKGNWVGGTVAPETDGHVKVVFDLLPSFVSHMADYGFTVQRYVEYSIDSAYLEGSSEIPSFVAIVQKAGNFSALSAEQRVAYTAALSQLYSSCEDGEGVCAYAFNFERVYDGKVYSGYYDNDSLSWSDLGMLCNFSDVFEVTATTLTPNNSHIVAG